MSKAPPLSGLITIAVRRATFRVCGVGASSSACSQAWAMSMLNRQVSGTLASLPPIRPVRSSFGASYRCA